MRRGRQQWLEWGLHRCGSSQGSPCTPIPTVASEVGREDPHLPTCDTSIWSPLQLNLRQDVALDNRSYYFERITDGTLEGKGRDEWQPFSTALDTAAEWTEPHSCLPLPIIVSLSLVCSEEELGPLAIPGCLIFSGFST